MIGTKQYYMNKYGEEYFTKKAVDIRIMKWIKRILSPFKTFLEYNGSYEVYPTMRIFNIQMNDINNSLNIYNLNWSATIVPLLSMVDDGFEDSYEYVRYLGILSDELTSIYRSNTSEQFVDRKHAMYKSILNKINDTRQSLTRRITHFEELVEKYDEEHVKITWDEHIQQCEDLGINTDGPYLVK